LKYSRKFCDPAGGKAGIDVAYPSNAYACLSLNVSYSMGTADADTLADRLSLP
jgi:hypothetical protein